VADARDGSAHSGAAGVDGVRQDSSLNLTKRIKSTGLKTG